MNGDGMKNPSLLNFHLQKKLLEKNGVVQIKIVSDSMNPIIKVGEILKVAPLRTEGEIKRFDIIVFFDGNTLKCHFVWLGMQNKFSSQITTRSLGDLYHDEVPLSRELILGWIIDRKIPLWWKLKIILLNTLRGTI
jgi:signal peptidase I